MSKTPNKDFQYKAVSAGIALGLCMVGRYTVPSAKLQLEFAFKRAWNQWDHQGRFPSVGKLFALDIPTEDPYIAFISANERVRTPHVPFYWDNGDQGNYQVYGREGSTWDADIPEDLDFVASLLSQDPTIPPAAWEELAKNLLAHLDA